MGAGFLEATSRGIISSHKYFIGAKKNSTNSLKGPSLFLIVQNQTTCLSLKQLVALEKEITVIGLDNQH